MPKKLNGASFRQVESGSSFPDNWDYKKIPTLIGEVKTKKQIEAKRGKKVEKIHIITVADEDGVLHTVWESHALEEFLKVVKAGDTVKIEYKGVLKLKGKKTLKQFNAFIAE